MSRARNYCQDCGRLVSPDYLATLCAECFARPAPLDVLAVLRLAEHSLIESGKQHRVTGDAAHGNMATRAALDMAEARAAVAELVAAARLVANYRSSGDAVAEAAIKRAQFVRLRAALAKFQS